MPAGLEGAVRVRVLRSSRVVLAAACLAALATSSSALARPAPTPGQRADVRRMLAPIATFQHAARARGDAVQQSVEQWIAEDGPCRRQARDGIAAAASGGTLTADDAATARELLSVPYGVDALHAMAQPLDAQLAVAQHAFATVRVRDRVLRSGARGMARGLAALRALPDVDFCGFAQQWASRGYALDAYVELTATIDASGIDQPAVQRAKKRLRRLGATAAQARRFEGFPLSVLM